MSVVFMLYQSNGGDRGTVIRKKTSRRWEVKTWKRLATGKRLGVSIEFFSALAQSRARHWTAKP